VSDKIKLYMEDWMKNAGIVGIYNILKHLEDDVEFNGDYVEFEIESLVNFEEKYYKYFREKYKDVTVYSSLINNIEYLIRINENDVDTKKYKKELKYIKDKLKNSAYKEIQDNIETKQLNKPTVEFLKKILINIKDKKSYILQKETIGYYDQKARSSKSRRIIKRNINIYTRRYY
jgi:CRISPR-associated protein Cst1